jgi:NAD-dependent dihydropyrimidine dehydrogenase PreA subunit
MAKLRYLTDVVTLKLHEDKCTGCGMCILVCPREVLDMTDTRAEIVDRDACIECGACALNCPAGAIEVDKGVGCAAAVIQGAIRGTEPQCCCCGGADAVCGADDGKPVRESDGPCCGSGPESPE